MKSSTSEALTMSHFPLMQIISERKLAIITVIFLIIHVMYLFFFAFKLFYLSMFFTVSFQNVLFWFYIFPHDDHGVS